WRATDSCGSARQRPTRLRWRSTRRSASSWWGSARSATAWRTSSWHAGAACDLAAALRGIARCCALEADASCAFRTPRRDIGACGGRQEIREAYVRDHPRQVLERLISRPSPSLRTTQSRRDGRHTVGLVRVVQQGDARVRCQQILDVVPDRSARRGGRSTATREERARLSDLAVEMLHCNADVGDDLTRGLHEFAVELT